MISEFIKIIFKVVILNPMALIGIVFGLYIMQNGGMDYINKITGDSETDFPQVLGILWGVAALYALLFKPVYHIDSTKINWLKTLTSSCEHLIVIICAAAVTVAVLSVSGANLGTKLDRYARNIKVQDTLPETK